MPWGLKRFQQSGQTHFVTFCCFRRRRNLGHEQVKSVFEAALERVRRSYRLRVYGYVVMPEHVHLLLSEPQRRLLADAIKSLKQGVARRQIGGAEHFWQKRYYDHNVRDAAKFVEKLRYIHRNPVKRGLCARPEDWEWSSFNHYATGVEGVVEIEWEWTARKRERAAGSFVRRCHCPTQAKIGLEWATSRTQIFSYDALNRISGASSNVGSGSDSWWQSYVMDAWGNLLQKQGSSDYSCFTTDPSNRIAQTCGGATVIQYDAAGNMTWDGVHAYTYDAENRITAVDTSSATYTYDADGNRVRKDVGSDATEYIYFGGQVLAEYKPATGDWTDYIYANGKRIAKTDAAPDEVRMAATNGIAGSIGYESSAWSSTDWVIEAGDKLVFSEYSTQPYAGMFFYLPDDSNSINTAVDTNGCLAAQFCGSGWMQRVVPLDNYVGSGNYIWHIDFFASPQAAGSWEARFKDVALVRADGTVKAVFNGQSSLPGWYVWNYAQATADIERVPESATNPTLLTTYYHSDHLGTARLLTNGYGYPVWSGTFLPFGAEFNPQVTTNNYKFTGKERDFETGLDDFGARYYASSMGRFRSPDWSANPTPMPFADVGSPQSLNLYSYVDNNRSSRLDPDGHANLSATDSDPSSSVDWSLVGPGLPPCICKTPQDAKGNPIPPPVAPPRGINGEKNSWVLKKPTSEDRDFAWESKYPTNPNGSKAGASWDDGDVANGKPGHYDVDDGWGNPRRHYTPDGKQVDEFGNPDKSQAGLPKSKFDAAADWVGNHKTEIVVGGVVIGTAVLAPELLPAEGALILRTAQ